MADPRVEPTEDALLVAAARSGDMAAFEELVRSHQHEVYGLAMRLTGNRELAADVAQEALVRAWRALPNFRGDAAFSTWIYRITVNVAWTRKRQAARRAARSLDEIGEVAEASSIGPEQAGEAADLRGRIRRALDQLPAGQRTLVVLKDVEGWTHAEIADALGISVSAAKVRLHRAHLKLRALLKEHR